MLKGRLIYTEENEKFVYNIEAVDSTNSFQGFITSGSYDATQWLEERDDISNPLELRRFDIDMSKCTIESSLMPEGVKNCVNPRFFVRFCSILRYIKSHCTSRNREGYTGLSYATDEFYADTCQRFQVPLGDNKETYAFVELEVGYIRKISFSWFGYNLSLEEVYEPYPKQVIKIKNKATYNLSYSSNYIGFDGKLKYEPVTSDTSSLMYSCLEEIIANHPEKSYDWLLGNKYMIVTDDILEEVCSEIRNHDGLVYYDNETTGLKFNFKCEQGQGDRLVGLILSVKYGEAYFFPVAMNTIPNLCDGDDVYFMEHYMRPILEGKDIVVHNMEFDWRVSYVYGINANIVHDTMLLYKLTLGAEKPDMPVNLKYLASLFLKRDSLELSDLVKADDWGESGVKFCDLPKELVRLYACPDTDNCMGLLEYATRNNLLQRYNARKVYEIELNFTFAVAYQEYYGQFVDLNRLDQLKTETQSEQEKAMSNIVEMLGHKINLNSPPQLIKAMYTEMGIPTQYSRETGRPTTEAEALKRLAELENLDGSARYPFVRQLQNFRDCEAIRKVIDSFPTLITSDGYLFSKVDQFKSTGRVSTKDPNYQGYNDTMKKYIVPRPKYYMTDQDYSSVESRILVSMVGNKETIESFKDPDFDYHRSRASRMFSIVYEAVTSALRRQSKGVNFGLFYGMADPSLGCHIFGEETPENTRKAAVLRGRYFVGLEDVERAMNKWRADSVKNGFTSTFFGRRRYYNKAKFSNSKIRRQGGNQVIQGTAADIYKMAVGNLFKRICKEGWLGKVLFSGFIHDELLSEVSLDIDPQDWLRVSREEFQVKIEGWCPIYMGFGYGSNWEMAKHVEIPVQLQDAIINDFDSLGITWNRNIDEFCAQLPDLIARFTDNMVKEYLLDSNNYGKYMKTSIFSSMLDVLKDKLGKDNVPETLEEQIQEYSKLHDITIPESSFLEVTKVSNDINAPEDSMELKFDYDDYDPNELSAEEKQKLIDMRVANLGMYLDTDDKIVYLNLIKDTTLMSLIKGRANQSSNGYLICFMDMQEKMKYTTKSYLTSEDAHAVQDLYVTYMSKLA